MAGLNPQVNSLNHKIESADEESTREDLNRQKLRT